ncbi:DHHW family protein [Acidiluteibacter ferrifornacis]|uniref:AlgX/AlgJ SGNH hydrolase-like domain-containing protein n=1 Tax=Acidiluteibacter ferrifornacis TaxID=2692424 RepID=A0A6N9NG22_9FLAO|nr:DHHW family protein [Acidiluteibacter ferrifornacis]NBG64501.1 hypothetical protein [Acidiluteibacter ferrifornacis]
MDVSKQATIKHSINIAPGQIGALVSEKPLQVGLNRLVIPRPSDKEVLSLNILFEDELDIVVKGFELEGLFGTITIPKEKLFSAIRISKSDLTNPTPAKYIEEGILVSLNNQMTTFTIKNTIFRNLDFHLFYWQKFIAIIAALLVFIVLLTLYFLGKLSLNIKYNANFCLTFITFLFTPLITPKDNRSRENRELASFPDLNVNIWRIPKNFDKYYNDHFPFRNELRFIGNYVKFHAFNMSPKPDVVRIGKEGWLFNAAEDVVQLNRGAVLYSNDQLDKIKSSLEAKATLLEQYGIAYYLVIPPMKHRVYPEYLPNSLKQVSNTTKWKQLINYLKENSFIRLIDPYETLVHLKKDHIVYYQTDTHWNRLGAFYVYQLIINRIREDFPQISPTLSIQDFIVETKVDSSGDLVGLIDMKNTFARTTYYLTPKNSSEHVLLNIGVNMEGESNFMYYIHENKNQPRMLLYRDSYSEYLRSHLAEHFSYSGIVWGNRLNDKRILQEKPDIIIHEMMERFIDDLLVE